MFFIIVLLFAIVAGGESETLHHHLHHLPPPSPKVITTNCTYLVTIETTCTKGAETTDRVALRFGDVKSNDVLVQRLNSVHLRRLEPLDPEVLDDVPMKPFQACVVDQFQVTGRCVESPVCYLYLKLVGDDDWRPGFAQVQPLDGTHLRSEYFYFRRYLPRNVWHGIDLCRKEVTPFGIKSKRKQILME
ncbi:embryo-specific protein ATS3A-like [Impatiens glandulifera]|uniref:embryo-specific protein ATS3A-like n=1 Tax=Impatiens glandulifera TaxID=253017 RepID=UPI001FB0CA10|nr:embryo-specific protein ATS3A-like [Impatiens glandulifera]